MTYLLRRMDQRARGRAQHHGNMLGDDAPASGIGGILTSIGDGISSLFGGSKKSTQEALQTNSPHSRIPFRAAPKYLIDVKTVDDALNYAAGGFHVSTARGIAGGCTDTAESFARATTAEATCNHPLNRQDLRDKWQDAANAYADAYGQILTAPATSAKNMLGTANAIADLAWRAEGLSPPRDRRAEIAAAAAGAPRPPGETPKATPKFMLAGMSPSMLALGGLLVFGGLQVVKGKPKRKGKGRKRARKSRRRSRGRR